MLAVERISPLNCQPAEVRGPVCEGSRRPPGSAPRRDTVDRKPGACRGLAAGTTKPLGALRLREAVAAPANNPARILLTIPETSWFLNIVQSNTSRSPYFNLQFLGHNIFQFCFVRVGFEPTSSPPSPHPQATFPLLRSPCFYSLWLLSVHIKKHGGGCCAVAPCDIHVQSCRILSTIGAN